jgi:hypothetical protein
MPSPPSALQGKKTNTGVTNGLKGLLINSSVVTRIWA